MNEVYDRIRRLRIAWGLSQEELAQLVGYTDRSMMSKIEAGKVDLPLSKIVLIAAALHTTPQALLFPGSNTTPGDQKNHCDLCEIKENLAAIESLLQRLPEIQAAVFMTMQEERDAARMAGKHCTDIWEVPKPTER